MGGNEVGAIAAAHDPNGRQAIEGKGRQGAGFTNGISGANSPATRIPDRIGGILSQLIQETEDLLGELHTELAACQNRLTNLKRIQGEIMLLTDKVSDEKA